MLSMYLNGIILNIKVVKENPITNIMVFNQELYLEPIQIIVYDYLRVYFLMNFIMEILIV